MSWRGIVVVSILTLGSSGCFTARKKFVPPPPLPVVARPAPQPQIEAPPEIAGEMPRIEVPDVALQAPPEVEPPPSKPVQARRPASGSATPGPATPAGPPAPEVETPPPAPAPQLGEIMPDARRRQYEALFTARVSGAQAALSRASNRHLSQRQQETVKRIQTFLQQAEETKVKDLVTALEFARRADLFGRDLLKSLQ